MHKDKTASIWRGIRSLVKLKSSSKKDTSIIDDKRGNYFRSRKKIVINLIISLVILV